MENQNKNLNKIKVTLTFNISNQLIDDILCTAFEGGINYWCNKVEVSGKYLGQYASDQISRDGKLFLFDAEEEEKEYMLNKNKFIKGLRLAIKNGYVSLDDGTIDEANIDANIADIIVQYALFNEIIYG